MLQLIDTHIHLDLLDNAKEQCAEARKQGVTRFIAPGTRVANWTALMDCVSAIPGAAAAPGVHPMDARRWKPSDTDRLCQLLDRSDTAAVGEVGLDRRVDVSREVQESVFRQMIRLACDTGKPLLLHSRETTGRLVEILREEQAGRVGGILHAFNGSLEIAHELIRLGFAVGIGGIITYPEARRLPGIIDQLPVEWLVLETDAPDMPPHPHREQANRPENLCLVAEKLAELRGWSLAETAHITTNNARRVLRLE